MYGTITLANLLLDLGGQALDKIRFIRHEIKKGAVYNVEAIHELPLRNKQLVSFVKLNILWLIYAVMASDMAREVGVFTLNERTAKPAKPISPTTRQPIQMALGK